MRLAFKFLFVVFLAASCGQINNSTTLSAVNNQQAVSCFENIDTTKAGQALCCSGSISKLINDEYVISISYASLISYRLDSCYMITVDSTNRRMVELLVFKKSQASLINICTDVIITNTPEPTAHLFAQSGELQFLFNEPIEYYGNMMDHVSVFIKRLVFNDVKSGRKIEFENELIWKVLDTGIPG